MFESRGALTEEKKTRLEGYSIYRGVTGTV